jgi:DNA invertase Pin-like site-specific DNA recombinase
MVKAFSYVRFSTPEQAQGDSLRRQAAKAEAWAKERGLELDNSLRDLGISAFHGANRIDGAFGTFLKMVNEGKIERGSFLIVESLDRLSRENVIDAASQLLALINAGIVVVTLSDGQEYSANRLRENWTPLVISLAVMARAHDESRIKSDRIGEVWQQKKAAARTHGTPMTPRCPEWLEVREGRFVERPDRVEIVRRIFQETIDGFGRREIVRRLNSDGIPTFRANERATLGWGTSSVAKIVQNRAVLGEYQPHTGSHSARNRTPDGDPIPNLYPQIVTEDVFWRAQASLESRKQNSGGRRGDRGAHILRGLAKCAVCGGPMHVINKGAKPKGGLYFGCSVNSRNAGCHNGRMWRLDKLEEAVLLCLTSFKTSLFDSLTGEKTDYSGALEAAKAELDDLNRRAGILLDLAETGNEQASGRFRTIVETIEVKKKELQRVRAKVSVLQNDPGDKQRLDEIMQLSTSLFNLEGQDRLDARIRLSALIQRMTDGIVCDPECGAYMVVTVDKKAWKVVNPTEGSFAYQLDIGSQQEGTPPPRLLFLLVKNPSESERDSFYQGRGGMMITAKEMVSFVASNRSRQ